MTNTIRLHRNDDGSYRYGQVEIVPQRTESGASIEGWWTSSPKAGDMYHRTLKDVRDWIARHEV